MRKFDRFCNKYDRFGIKNLMVYIATGNAVLLMVAFFPGGDRVIDMLSLYPDRVMSGEVWRLISFIFIFPGSASVFSILSIYFYLMMGRWLEREWGTLKFTIYYLTGIIMNAAFSMLLGIPGNMYFLNMSLFFALATLFPDFQILLFFVLPIKLKWLAVLDALFFVYYIAVFPFPVTFLPLVSVLNYFIYFYPSYVEFFKNRGTTAKYRARKSEAFRESPKGRGYSHKCAACGRTDAQYPNLEFRYCSLCSDYSCYCELHVADHEHR